MEDLDRATNSDRREDPRFSILQEVNTHKLTTYYLQPDPFEIKEDPEPKKESIEIESLSYFDILFGINLFHLIPPLFHESQ